MKIVIPGGTGQIGQLLARHLIAAGHDLVILGRHAAGAGTGRFVRWDGRTAGNWIRELDGSDAVIHLAGRSVNCRYNARNRAEILDSRIESTRAVGRALRQCQRPPRVWLQASTATLYAHRYDAPNDEATGLIGGSEPDTLESWNFSIRVAQAWEQAAIESAPPSARLVLLRSAMTMSPDPGGVFDVLLTLMRRGLGGTNGDGRQYVSWIHERDFCRAIDRLLLNPWSGPVNICSPNPIPNADFMRILRRAAGMRIGLPATRWMLEIGAWFLRTETELILKSRRVVPGRLLESGFRFDFPDWPTAAADLVARSPD
jgi:hypothetical protein